MLMYAARNSRNSGIWCPTSFVMQTKTDNFQTLCKILSDWDIVLVLLSKCPLYDFRISCLQADIIAKQCPLVH